MRFFVTLLAFALVNVSIAVPTQQAKRLLNTVVKPSQDPFYQAPTGYENAAPGTILNSRQIAVPLAIELLTPGITSSVWQVQYRSTDDAGNPLAMVTTIFVPVDGDTNKFFTQAIAYDSSSIDCSPSYSLRVLTQASPDIAAIALGLYDGWYVQSPDFEGPSAAFTNGIISAHGMLDSLRAGLLSTNMTGLAPTARIALNGGSGGALGCEWALELQSTYAPELNIAGATLGSLTPVVQTVIETVNGGAFAGLIPAAITGLAKASTALDAYLNASLVPETAANFRSAETRCVNDNQAFYASQNVSNYFTNPNWIEDEVPQEVLKSVGIMGLHGVPQVPIYVYKGAEDELSTVLDTDALVTKYCHESAPSIVYVRNIVTGHETESLIGFVGAYEYLQERLNGIPPLEGCTIINSTKSTLNNTDSTALGAIIGPKVVSVLQNALPSLLTE
ncbi:hypothetical protein AMS68_007197 [Peltaster fructicola]|uniref:Secretory lipase-domain-containing protein n=1 Tax=Peltaster fructicola TaxID=286661 RepID=A0A6H0Y4Z3_9PEZI|nr:hypothetical protein AMS68_007197 [Peltaster fructicola]